MNIREKAIAFIRANPDSSARHIARGAEIPSRMIQPLLTELLICEVVLRHTVKGNPYSYRLVSEEDLAGTSVRYRALREKAVAREDAGLWRRAARLWLQAMDVSNDPEARGRAAARREYCINMASRGVSGDSTGMETSVRADIDIWGD